MASNSKNIAELLNGDTTLTATDIANDAVTADKIAICKYGKEVQQLQARVK